MRVIVTGANGVIGRFLLEELVAGGHETIALLRPGSPPPGPANTISVIEIDLAEPLAMGQLPTRTDTIVHLAHGHSYRDFPEGTAKVFQINTALTVALADYARKAGTSKFLYASTGTVYRNRPEPFDEDAETIPSTFYAATKLAAEHLLRPYSELFAVLIARLFYVYGPGQTSMLISNLARRMFADRAVTLQGPDGVRVAPLYSADAARVLLLAMTEGWIGTYNVGHPKSTTIRALATEIGRIIGREPRFEQVSATAPTPCLPRLDRLSQHVDLAKFVHLDEGLRRMFGRAS